MTLLANNAQPMRLFIFFENVFVPECLGNHTTRTNSKYKSSIKRFRDSLRRDPLVADLSDTLIQACSRWMTDSGLSAHRANATRQCLRRLAAESQKRDLATGWVSGLDLTAEPRRYGRHDESPSDEQILVTNASVPPTIANGAMTLTELVDSIDLERGWATGNRKNYDAMVTSVQSWSGRTLHADCFAADWVNRYLLYAEGTGISPWTVDTRRRAIISLWRAAHDRNYVSELPKRIRLIKKQRKPPEAWNYQEVNEQLLARSSRLEGLCVFQDQGHAERAIAYSMLWRLIIRFYWDTALRSQDGRNVLRNQIADDGVIFMSQSKTASWHVCKIHPSTLELINSLDRPADAPVLPWYKTPKHFSEFFVREISRPCGLAGTPIKLRKSSASDVELRFPGAGAAHLGHRAGNDIAKMHYLDPRVTAENRPMPRELTADL